MLNIFPDLLYLSFFAPTILRFGLGLIFIFWGLRSLFKDKLSLIEHYNALKIPFSAFMAILFGVIEVIFGALLVVGLFTQVVALLSALLMTKLMVLKRMGRNIGGEGYQLYILVFFVCLSLLVTGAGAFAFDRPL